MLILGNVNSSVLFNENKIIVSPQIQIKINKVDYFVDSKKRGCTRTEDVIGACACERLRTPSQSHI